MYNVDLITFVMKASISSSHFEHDLLVKKKTVLCTLWSLLKDPVAKYFWSKIPIESQ